MSKKPWELISLNQLGRLHQIYGAVFVLAGLIELVVGLSAWWWRWGGDGSPFALILLAAVVLPGLGAAIAGVVHGRAGRHIRRGYNMWPALWSSVLAVLFGGPFGVVLAMLTLIVVRGGKSMIPEEDEEALPEPDAAY